MTKEQRTRQIHRRVLASASAVALVAALSISFENKEADAYECDAYNSQSRAIERPENEVDPVERDLLAHVIYAEAGACSESTRKYVGSVVLNRIKDEAWPDTMQEVVYQTEPAIQYGCTYDGNIDKDPDNEAYEIADELLRYGSVIPSNVTYQSEYIQGTGIWKEVDGIYFCFK